METYEAYKALEKTITADMLRAYYDQEDIEHYKLAQELVYLWRIGRENGWHQD